MGVMTDYFRAPDAERVVQAMSRTKGGPLVGGHEPVFDGVEAKGVDPGVVLAQLVAAIRRVPWSVSLVEETVVWPTTPPPGPEGPADEDDPWATGPWVSRLDDATRDALAGVDAAALPGLAAEWARAEEFDRPPIEPLRSLAEDLVRLAARARATGDHLYCWICL